MGQAEFAAFVEDNLHDLTSAPKEWGDAGEYTQPAAVVQAVRTLAVHTGIKFKSVINRDTGATEMLFDLEHDQKDVAKIPRGFVLAIPVYLNGAVYAVRARIRFRKTDEKAMFQYAIVGPEVLLRDAFNDVRTQAVTGTGLPMFCGTPRVGMPGLLTRIWRFLFGAPVPRCPIAGCGHRAYRWCTGTAPTVAPRSVSARCRTCQPFRHRATR